jgi:two-component system, cell cycle response regulator
MAAKARILAIDDQLYFRNFLVSLLSEEGYEVIASPAGAAGREALEQRGPFDLAITDVPGPGRPAADWVAALREVAPELETVVVTGVGDVATAVAAMQQGASDFLLKPIDRGALLGAIHRALYKRSAASIPTRLLDENIEFMGRLSLLERIVPLLGELDLTKAAVGLLELCCTEACATQGALWLRGDDSDALICAATFGEIDADLVAREWSPPSATVRKTLASGLAVIAPDPGAPEPTSPCLFVPFFAREELVAVARVSGRVEGEFGEPDAHASLEVGELSGVALGNSMALREAVRDRLRDPVTQLPSRRYFSEVLDTELSRAHRFGRRLCCLCVELELPAGDPRAVQGVVRALTTTLRTTDVLCSEGPERYWVLVTETDPLGGVVLKRRIADRIREEAASLGTPMPVSTGLASYPLDGDDREALLAHSIERARAERESVIHELGFDASEPLSRIGERLLERSTPLPATLLGEVAEFLIGELTCRPHDSGLLFLAPGADPAPIMGPLMAMGDAETATEVFLATDGDTVPACSALTAVALPPQFSMDTTWMVRFGEGPPYALIAGATQDDGLRPIYHTTDPVLVEHMTFRLCAEVGVGVRS